MQYIRIYCLQNKHAEYFGEEFHCSGLCDPATSCPVEGVRGKLTDTELYLYFTYFKSLMNYSYKCILIQQQAHINSYQHNLFGLLMSYLKFDL